ncbi:MAG: imidazole glycerol phosphate synthase subunit HisH [Candidatus Omnitrophica bacterium]|nr:imidazole glycerol phosphate synthase subunit HisH [Candidatus Omnitrophota bacterium]
MIAIIDYGSGNLRSVYNAFRYIGEDVLIAETPGALVSAERIVLPGVGAVRDALDGLNKGGFVEQILAEIKKGKPFLGLCLGLQLLFDESEESGGAACFGLIKGEVKKFPAVKNLKVPHMGWNTVDIKNDMCPLFKGIKNNSYFYFVHSYYCDALDGRYSVGKTRYGLEFTSAVWKENVFALQFHPERSQANGLKLLRNFVNI